jgi:hypothetical protein
MSVLRNCENNRVSCRSIFFGEAACKATGRSTKNGKILRALAKNNNNESIAVTNEEQSVIIKILSILL